MATFIPPLIRRGEGVMSASSLSRYARAGRIVQVLPGVYLRSDVVQQLPWRANAVAAWRPSAVLTGRFAAALTFWPDLRVDSLEFACESTVRREGITFTRRVVPPAWVKNRGQLQLTHPALTALDLCLSEGGEAIDTVLRSRRARIDDLRAALDATAGRRGNRDRRRLLLDSRAEPWSFAERRAHTLYRDAGIAGWRANVGITIDGREYFLDIAFESIRLAIEIDGRAFHSGASPFETDRLRQNAMVLDRWVILRFTYRQLVEDPDYVVRTTLAGIAQAQQRRRRR